MHWQHVAPYWHEMRKAAKREWADLSNEDLDDIQGERERWIEKLQTVYGMEKSAAESSVDKFVERYKAEE